MAGKSKCAIWPTRGGGRNKTYSLSSFGPSFRNPKKTEPRDARKKKKNDRSGSACLGKKVEI